MPMSSLASPPQSCLTWCSQLSSSLSHCGWKRREMHVGKQHSSVEEPQTVTRLMFLLMQLRSSFGKTISLKNIKKGNFTGDGRTTGSTSVRACNTACERKLSSTWCISSNSLNWIYCLQVLCNNHFPQQHSSNQCLWVRFNKITFWIFNKVDGYKKPSAVNWAWRKTIWPSFLCNLYHVLLSSKQVFHIKQKALKSSGAQILNQWSEWIVMQITLGINTKVSKFSALLHLFRSAQAESLSRFESCNELNENDIIELCSRDILIQFNGHFPDLYFIILQGVSNI